MDVHTVYQLFGIWHTKYHVSTRSSLPMDAMGESLAVGMRQFRCAKDVPAPSEISYRRENPAEQKRQSQQ
jgi:hypothetical protein